MKPKIKLSGRRHKRGPLLWSMTFRYTNLVSFYEDDMRSLLVTSRTYWTLAACTQMTSSISKKKCTFVKYEVSNRGDFGSYVYEMRWTTERIYVISNFVADIPVHRQMKTGGREDFLT
jgi:hypothetical protein